MKLRELNLQKKTCILNNKEQYDLENSISLYVVTTRQCNAQCKFCEFRGDSDKIDIEIFNKTFEELNKRLDINMVHFTGGEPTLELDTIKQLCKLIKSKKKCIKTSVNTNGIKLRELADIEELDNVALSRHGITDSENRDIFGTNSVANEFDIVAFPKHKLHLSCNLIQGHINSEEKIYQYLEKCATLGVYDVGFVGLMGVNQYCKDNYIEYPELSKCTLTKQYKNIQNNECSCECRNWLYRASNCNLISLYHRHFIKDNGTVGYLVYENNKLRAGFNGDYIEL